MPHVLENSWMHGCLGGADPPGGDGGSRGWYWGAVPSGSLL